MTVSTIASQSIAQGNGAITSFSFSFIADSPNDIEVIYTDATGAQTTLTSAQYTLIINPPAVGQIWGIGGTVTYPIAGPPIANGTSLTIRRTVPLTQIITITNQGDFAPVVIEEALDTLCFEIQQIAARTGQMRGTWATGISYNFGDIVQDGANGANSKNYYACAIANTSGVWATDLAAGDWSLVIQATLPAIALPLSVVNGGTGVTTSTGTGSVVLSASPTFTGTVNGAALVLSGNDTAAAFIPTAANIPANGIYLPAANTVGIAAQSLLAAQFINPALGVNYFSFTGATAGNSITLSAAGTDSNISFILISKGSSATAFATNGSSGNIQCSVAHTPNAVDYVQITGGATGSPGVVAISAQGSDSNIILNTRGKGTGGVDVGGTSTSNNSSVGSVGEYMSSSVSTSTTINLTNNTAKTISGITLSPGDWDVWGLVGYTNASTTTITTYIANGLSTVIDTFPSQPNEGGAVDSYINRTGGSAGSLFCQRRYTCSINTTIYLIGYASFTVSTMSAYGTIAARRRR